MIQHRHYRKAVYAGSFDPMTFGHLHIIRAACHIFDEVIVAIGDNPEKKYAFSFDDRMAMLKEVLESDDYRPQHCFSTFDRAHGLPDETIETVGCKLRIEHFTNKFLINYVRDVGAEFIVRGIRNEDDYKYERDMAFFNAHLEFGSPIVQTVWIPCRKDLSELSSSFVKGICGPDYWQRRVQSMVPEPVFKRLLAWKGCPEWTDREE